MTQNTTMLLTTCRFIGLLRDPPEAGKYTALKTELLCQFWLSDAECVERLLSVNGLVDSKPSELMENMLALFGSGDTLFMFVQLFLPQLPPSVCSALACTKRCIPPCSFPARGNARTDTCWQPSASVAGRSCYSWGTPIPAAAFWWIQAHSSASEFCWHLGRRRRLEAARTLPSGPSAHGMWLF